MSEIKIYEIGPTFYAAKNLRDAVREHISDSGDSIRETLEEVQLVSESDLERLTFVDDVYDSNPENKRSFKAQLEKVISEGTRFPCAFASSEW